MLQYISTTAILPPTIVTAVDKLDELILSYFYNIKNEFGMKKILLLFLYVVWAIHSVKSSKCWEAVIRISKKKKVSYSYCIVVVYDFFNINKKKTNKTT